MQITRELCAPDSGWPDDLPQTPENLLPYVADEVDELAETLHQASLGTKLDRSDVRADLGHNHLPSTQLISDLTTDWLWAIAASTPVAMKLLEGVATQIPGHPYADGIRLVPILIVHTQGDRYCLDLATQSCNVPQRPLTDDVLVHLAILPQGSAMSLANWDTLIWTQAIAVAPELAQWREGQAVELQLPGVERAAAKLSLELWFEPLTTGQSSSQPEIEVVSTVGVLEKNAIPSARVWQAAPSSPTPKTISSAHPSTPLPRPGSLESDITFKEPSRLETAYAKAAEIALGHRLRMQFGQAAPHRAAPLAIIKGIYPLLGTSSELPPALGTLPQTLSEVCTQVEWLWIKASRDLMGLISGLAGRRLRSGHDWERGEIATVGQLVFSQRGAPTGVLEVTTGEWISPAAAQNEADALHLLDTAGLPQAVWSVAALTHYVNTTVKGRSPVLASLMQGHPITLSSPQDVLFSDAPAGDFWLSFHIAPVFHP